MSGERDFLGSITDSEGNIFEIYKVVPTSSGCLVPFLLVGVLFITLLLQSWDNILWTIIKLLFYLIILLIVIWIVISYYSAELTAKKILIYFIILSFLICGAYFATMKSTLATRGPDYVKLAVKQGHKHEPIRNNEEGEGYYFYKDLDQHFKRVDAKYTKFNEITSNNILFVNKQNKESGILLARMISLKELNNKKNRTFLSPDVTYDLGSIISNGKKWADKVYLYDYDDIKVEKIYGREYLALEKMDMYDLDNYNLDKKKIVNISDLVAKKPSMYKVLKVNIRDRYEDLPDYVLLDYSNHGKTDINALDDKQFTEMLELGDDGEE